jgi:hypothetical protein
MGQDVVEKRGYIGFTAGPGFTTGDFGDDDFEENENAGYAKSGVTYSFDFGYRLGRRWGITASYKAGNSPVDENAFSASLNQLIGGSWKTSADNYKYNAILVGPMVSWPKEKVDIDVRLGLGYGFGPLPAIKLYESGQLVESIGSEDASGAAVMIGGSLRYHLSKQFSLTGQLNYLSISLETDRGEETIEQPVDLFIIDLGFLIRM